MKTNDNEHREYRKYRNKYKEFSKGRESIGFATWLQLDKSERQEKYR